jgi:hypothetical protein
MSAHTEVVRTMVPPRVEAPQRADAIGRFAAVSLQALVWATGGLLRTLRWLDAWLGRQRRADPTERA